MGSKVVVETLGDSNVRDDRPASPDTAEQGYVPPPTAPVAQKKLTKAEKKRQAQARAEAESPSLPSTVHSQPFVMVPTASPVAPVSINITQSVYGMLDVIALVNNAEYREKVRLWLDLMPAPPGNESRSEPGAPQDGGWGGDTEGMNNHIDHQT
jgi:hypothetical protein